MVYLIVGQRDAGKTKKIISLQSQFGGDGICMPKVFSDSGKFLGYNIRRLSRSETLPFVRCGHCLPPAWKQIDQCGDFSFSATGIDFAEAAVSDLLHKNITPLFIDEIGPLELKGRGFNQLVLRLLAGRSDLYLTVRLTLLASLIRTYALTAYSILTCN
ncbi:MAG: hypothetical protein JXI33_09085 [Candidatus Aminicenantes bacterium]|nr:hypothetical protein [Candidatus Aminicenantes bacterium]